MNRYASALLSIALVVTALTVAGCPAELRAVEIVLSNTSGLYQVRTLQITDDETGPVTANLLETQLQPGNSRRITVPFTNNIEASDAIAVGLGAPDGNGITVTLSDDIDDGFSAGKTIVLVVTNVGPNYTPLDNAAKIAEPAGR